MTNAVLAAVGVALLVVAAALVAPALGFAAAGVGVVGAAYVKQYLEAHREDSGASR